MFSDGWFSWYRFTMNLYFQLPKLWIFFYRKYLSFHHKLSVTLVRRNCIPIRGELNANSSPMWLPRDSVSRGAQGMCYDIESASSWGNAQGRSGRAHLGLLRDQPEAAAVHHSRAPTPATLHRLDAAAIDSCSLQQPAPLLWARPLLYKSPQMWWLKNHGKVFSCCSVGQKTEIKVSDINDT